jgi:hypothetical protein
MSLSYRALATAVSSALMCLSSPAARASTPTNVILIGWDACQRDHLKECIARNEVPNLMRLSKQGALVAIDAIRTTDTKAGWTQILTGMEPEKTGVFSNGRFGPIPVGYTIFERLEKHFGPDNIATVAIIGKKGHVDADPPEKIRLDEQQTPPAASRPAGRRGGRPGNAAAGQPGLRKPGPRKAEQIGQIVEENGVKYRLIPAKPYFNTKDHMDVFINGLEQNEKVGQTALEYLEKHKNDRFFFFVHFAQPDHVGHAFGENSKEYNDGIISDDQWTGRIMDKVKELGLADRTLIYVTADHGFDEGQKGHTDAPYVFLATNDSKVIRRGLRCDITPTILDRMGLDLTKLDPPLDGHSLARSWTPPRW